MRFATALAFVTPAFIAPTFLALACGTPAFVAGAWAQNARPPAQRPVKPPAKPDPITQSYMAVPEADRIAIQNDLIWTGDYNGTASADFNTRAVAAVKTFQKRLGNKETGVLNPKERGQLSAAAKRRRDAAGWQVLTDGITGMRLGIPLKLVSSQLVVTGGTRWASARGEVQVETFRITEPGTTLQSVYEAQRKMPERKISYNVARGDFFVVAGLQGGVKKFYVRGQFKDGQVRGFSVLYDQAMEVSLDHVVIAMSSTLQAFPGVTTVAVPPPRRKVEYGSGVFVSAQGHVVTTRDLIDGCQVFNLAGYGPADLLAEDKEAGLALLRIFGVRDLKPIALAENGTAADATLIGIADPERQSGGKSVSTASARLLPPPNGQRAAIDPVPGLGFAGAAAVDRNGRLLGLADVGVQVVAGTPTSTAPQATLVPASAIKAFLAKQEVAPAAPGTGGIEAAKAAVVRVICVRK